MLDHCHTGSSPQAKLIIVDKNDNIQGYKTHAQCHDGNGILHRAFSVFIFNGSNRLLMQKRSPHKRLWPLYWSNSCCSHPRRGETTVIAAHCRIKEELGISTPLRYVFKFRYHAVDADRGSESELCSVYLGRTNATVAANADEIADWKFMDVGDFEKGLAEQPERYTPWIHLEWEYLRSRYQALLR